MSPKSRQFQPQQDPDDSPDYAPGACAEQLEASNADPKRRAVAREVLNEALKPGKEEEQAIYLQEVASKVLFCGTQRNLNWRSAATPNFVWQSCDYPALCSRCSGRRARDFAQLDAARIGRVLENFPHLRLLQARLALGGSSQLREAVERLFAHLSDVRKSNREPWDLVVAGIAQVHPHRGVDGLWRPHLHIILLVHPVKKQRLDRLFCREMGLEKVREHEDGWTGKSGDADWFFRQFSGQNSSQPDVFLRIGASPEAHAYRTSKYDADHVNARPVDRVAAFLALPKLNPRRMWGPIIGAPADELQKTWDRIERDNHDLARRSRTLFCKGASTPAPPVDVPVIAPAAPPVKQSKRQAKKKKPRVESKIVPSTAPASKRRPSKKSKRKRA